MPVTEDKTLRQTLTEVIGQTATPTQDQTAPVAEGISKGNSDETQSGGTPEYVSGIDISDIPEQDRPKFREKLGTKAKLLEDGYNKKFQEVAKLRAELEKKPETAATETKKAAMRTIDVLRESATDLESRKGLDNLEKIILESTGITEIREKLEKLERVAGVYQTRELTSRQTSINSTLDALSQEYGKGFIDKYREAVTTESLKYIDADPEQILNAIVPPRELKQAILSNQKKTENRTQEKINAVSSSSPGMSGSRENVDIRKSSLKGLLTDLMTKKV